MYPVWFVTRVPGLYPFLRYAFLLRMEDRGRPSVVCPFAGTSVHRTLALFRLTHWTFALIRFTRAPPIRACLRHHSSLGLSKGAKKSNTTLAHSDPLPVYTRGSA